MAKKSPMLDRGRVVGENIDSRVLAGNRLGDPTDRALAIYLPPKYDHPRRALRRFPVLFDMVGFTGAGPSHTNWKAFEENVPERLDRLINSGAMPPTIVVFPDCFTALGGNQYVNSSAIGRYADYLTRELIPLVDKSVRSMPTREHRGCFGKSSGGYGAMIHGMKYTKYWGAIGNHSGDAYFDFVYQAEWPAVLTALQRFAQPEKKTGRRTLKPTGKVAKSAQGMDDGRMRRFLEYCWSTEKLSGEDITTLMMLCMAATYDPDPKAPLGFRVPYDFDSGELIEQRWRAWLKHDPIHLVSKYRDNLKKLRGIYIDCGWRDQYHIHFGSRQLSTALHKNSINHRYEEFDGTHSGVDHRMDVSLPYLARKLA